MPLWTQGKGQVLGRRDSNRGVLYSYVRNGVEITAKWPRKRGSNLHPKTKAQMEYFTQVQWAYKFSAAVVQRSFADAVAGTPLMPRDLYLMVQSGRAYMVIQPDGTKWYHMATIKSVSESLDAIAQLEGSMLVRGPDLWQVIEAPTEAGQVLTSTAADAPPSWQAGSGGASYERARVVPSLASVTLENPGAGGTAAVASDRTFGIQLASPSTSSNIRFLRHNNAPPAAPWELITRSEPVIPFVGGGHYNCCTVLRNSSNGRIIIAGRYNNGWLVQRWSSYIAFNANILAPVNWPMAANTPWQRVLFDGTTYSFQISPDGDAWATYATEAAATYLGTCDQFGGGNMVNGEPANDLLQSLEVVG